MKKTIFMLILSLICTSCMDKRVKNPEKVDLIYIDLKSDIEKIDKVIKLRETEIQIVKDEINSLPVRAKGRVVRLLRIEAMSSDITRFKQLKKYIYIKLRKRKEMAKIRYELRFQNNEPWPDKEEFRLYKIAKNNSLTPVEEINKSDNSRAPTHKKDIQKILKFHGL